MSNQDTWAGRLIFINQQPNLGAAVEPSSREPLVGLDSPGGGLWSRSLLACSFGLCLSDHHGLLSQVEGDGGRSLYIETGPIHSKWPLAAVSDERISKEESLKVSYTFGSHTGTYNSSLYHAACGVMMKTCFGRWHTIACFYIDCYKYACKAL